MINLQGVKATIREVVEHGTDMQDLYDLDVLYRLEERMSRDSMDEDPAEGKIDRETAEAWVGGLKNEDPAKPKGGKWSVDQIKPVAQKYGVPTEGERFWEFYSVMNALYSDYYGVAKKYSALTPEFFADMTMAFLNDKDAVENKALMYYKHIAKK